MVPEFNFSKEIYPPKPKSKPRKTPEEKEFENRNLFGIIYKRKGEPGIHIQSFTNEEDFDDKLPEFDEILEECRNVTIEELKDKIQRWRKLEKIKKKK